jgi:hypothetical protein
MFAIRLTTHPFQNLSLHDSMISPMPGASRLRVTQTLVSPPQHNLNATTKYKTSRRSYSSISWRPNTYIPWLKSLCGALHPTYFIWSLRPPSTTSIHKRDSRSNSLSSRCWLSAKFFWFSILRYISARDLQSMFMPTIPVSFGSRLQINRYLAKAASVTSSSVVWETLYISLVKYQRRYRFERYRQRLSSFSFVKTTTSSTHYIISLRAKQRSALSKSKHVF